MKQEKKLSISAQIAPLVAANAAALAAGTLRRTEAAPRAYKVKPDNIKAPAIAVGADGIIFVPGYLSN
ncbi:MAG: hypothetical protein J0M35_12850 [Candidatus Obscuribacter phosphatis]|uniref:Uncharacterized protein n=1 Tax=Candidatus Obscuribacter phosphatis TaxID=1906157 RepID=A0A8J7PIY7_9BACT|nr:hypothetical protein [Candidatus Obscuribacter phosphatis]